jgi:hypothetical protein
MARALRFIHQRLVFPSAPPSQVLAIVRSTEAAEGWGWDYLRTGAPSPVFVLTSAYPKVVSQKTKGRLQLRPVGALPKNTTGS